MICDELSEEEIYQAYLIYAALHGFDTDDASVRERISNYLEHNQPDAFIDDAILAYAEDCIVAPPDVVLAKWGSSRFYELERSPQSLARHQTCESWFENGCRFISDEDTPRLVHFWTAFELLHAFRSGSLPQELRSGTRLSLVLESNTTVLVLHRTWGPLGSLPTALSTAMHLPPLKDRKFLALVDNTGASQSPPQPTSPPTPPDQTEPTPRECKLLVMSSAADVPTKEFVDYAAEAFLADRNKC